jgi:hypothetical protein
LIMVAIALVVLLGFVGLAIDVGHLYGERRRMQNAADAGALAGAREICFGDPSQAEARAREYAIARNGAQDAAVSFLDGGWTVDVIATETADTFLAGLFGLSEADVRAEAAAACAAANSACGLWPIAFKESTWNYLLKDGGYICDDDVFFIWTGDNLHDNPDCKETYDCDPDNDGKDEFVDITSRGWLDFSDVVNNELYPDSCVQSGCGESELACWIKNDSTSKVTIPGCVPGLNGVKAGVKDEVNARIGQVVSVPIYDGTGCSGISCPGGQTYHVVDFKCITVRGWVQNYTLPRQDGSQPPWKGSVIRASITCGGCSTECGETSGAPPPPGGLRAVSLIR